jgi:uncharacterized membrane protein (UPF0127 family)
MDIGRMRLANAQGRALGQSLEVMRTSNAWERGRGLLGRKPLEMGQGLWISPCNSVHGFGMGYALDLVYLDKGLRVLKPVADFRPWRLSWCLGASSVLELPAGSINDFGIQSGFILEWQSYAN